VPVYVHPEELPYVTGRRDYPVPDPSVGGGLMARVSSMFPRRATDFGNAVHELPADRSLPGLPGWEWHHTPGHSAGHVSFFRRSDRTLIAGDAFCTTKQESLVAALTQRPELHGPPAYFTTDWDAARNSILTLSRLEPVSIAAGHGRPVVGIDAKRALFELAARFDVAARPPAGRYVAHPVPG